MENILKRFKNPKIYFFSQIYRRTTATWIYNLMDGMFERLEIVPRSSEQCVDKEE